MKPLIIAILMWSAPATAAELWLKVGEVRSLSAPRGRVVRIGTRGVVRVVDGETNIRVIGLKPGVTTVIIGSKSHMVHVSLSEQREFVFELRRLLAGMMGLKLQSDSATVRVTGTLLRFSDWLQMSELARRHQGEYFFAARALPDVAEEALAHFKRLAHDKGLPVARFRADPVFTVQVPKAPGLKDSAGNIFNSFGMRVEANSSQLELQPLVRTRVILAEVSRDQSMEFGVEWPSSYQAQVLPKPAAGQEQLLVSLRALESRGQAQILASPNLLCRSGSEARFHAGGEFPIRMISRTTRDVLWKQHGVMLRVKPRADFNGAISLEVETEVSVLNMAGAVDGIPALNSNKVKSHFDLPGRRTIALSGLLRQEVGDTREGIPLLMNLPVLGPLFSSQKFLKHLSELVIFVTPEIYVPEGDDTLTMPSGWISDEL